LNQYCTLPPDFESMLLTWARKIVLQHNPPNNGRWSVQVGCPKSAICGRLPVGKGFSEGAPDELGEKGEAGTSGMSFS
jgi:hypothetical protein